MLPALDSLPGSLYSVTGLVTGFKEAGHLLVGAIGYV